MARRPKRWKIREDYRKLLIKTKKLFPNMLNHVKIKRVALVGMYAKRSGFIARIYPSRRPWNLFDREHDYLIAFWSSRFDEKPLHYKIFVMLHELCHVPGDGFVKGSHGWRKTIHHDKEEFGFLMETYGIRLENVKDVMKGEEGLYKKFKKHKETEVDRIREKIK